MSFRGNQFASVYGQQTAPVMPASPKRGGARQQVGYNDPYPFYPQFRLIPQGQFHPTQFIQPANYAIPIGGYSGKMPIYAPEQQIIMMQQPQEPIFQQHPPIPTQRRNRIEQIQYAQQPRNIRRGTLPEQKQKNKRDPENQEQGYAEIQGDQGNDISTSLTKDDVPWPKPSFFQDPNSPPDFFNIIGRGNLPSFTFEPEPVN